MWQMEKRAPSLEGELEHPGTKHITTEAGVPKSPNSMVVEPEPEERAVRSELGETGKVPGGGESGSRKRKTEVGSSQQRAGEGEELSDLRGP